MSDEEDRRGVTKGGTISSKIEGRLGDL
jgi:hypothetical protein